MGSSAPSSSTGWPGHLEDDAPVPPPLPPLPRGAAAGRLPLRNQHGLPAHSLPAYLPMHSSTAGAFPCATNSHRSTPLHRPGLEDIVLLPAGLSGIEQKPAPAVQARQAPPAPQAPANSGQPTSVLGQGYLGQSVIPSYGCTSAISELPGPLGPGGPFCPPLEGVYTVGSGQLLEGPEGSSWIHNLHRVEPGAAYEPVGSVPRSIDAIQTGDGVPQPPHHPAIPPALPPRATARPALSRAPNSPGAHQLLPGGIQPPLSPVGTPTPVLPGLPASRPPLPYSRQGQVSPASRAPVITRQRGRSREQGPGTRDSTRKEARPPVLATPQQAALANHLLRHLPPTPSSPRPLHRHPDPRPSTAAALERASVAVSGSTALQDAPAPVLVATHLEEAVRRVATVLPSASHYVANTAVVHSLVAINAEPAIKFTLLLALLLRDVRADSPPSQSLLPGAPAEWRHQDLHEVGVTTPAPIISPMHTWHPSAPFQIQPLSVGATRMDFYNGPSPFLASAQVENLKDLVSFRAAVDIGSLAVWSHNTLHFLDTLGSSTGYPRDDGFKLPYESAAYEIYHHPTPITYNQCQNLALVSNGTLPSNFGHLDFVSDWHRPQGSLDNMTVWVLPSTRQSSGTEYSVWFDDVMLFPLSSHGLYNTNATTRLGSPLQCTVLHHRNGRTRQITPDDLLGYEWYDSVTEEYHTKYIMRIDAAISLRLDKHPGCVLFTPLKAQQHAPTAYLRDCLLVRSPLRSHLSNYELDTQRKQLVSAYKELDLDLEQFRLPKQGATQKPIPLPSLQPVPILPLSSPHEPLLASRANRSKPLSSLLDEPLHSGYFQAALLRKLSGSQHLDFKDPPFANTLAQPSVAAVLAQPVSMIESAGGFLLRRMGSRAAEQLWDFAKAQAEYRLLDPLLLRLVNQQESPARLVDELNTQLPRNLTAWHENNLILVRALQENDYLSKHTILSTSHYKSGLQLAAYNLEVLKQALSVIDNHAVEAGLGLLSKYKLHLSESGPAFVTVSRSGSFFLLEYYVTCHSTEAQTTYHFHPLPAYTTYDSSSALFLNLPGQHLLSPLPSTQNRSLAKVACADFVLSSTFQQTGGALNEDHCQMTPHPLQLLTILHASDQGKLVMAARLQSFQLTFFLACQGLPAQRFTSQADVNIFFLPASCSFRVSTKSKIMELPGSAPIPSNEGFLFLLAYNINFQPFRLTDDQLFVVLILTFACTMGLCTMMALWAALKYRRRLQLLFMSPPSPSLLRSTPPSPPPAYVATPSLRHQRSQRSLSPTLPFPHLPPQDSLAPRTDRAPLHHQHGTPIRLRHTSAPGSQRHRQQPSAHGSLQHLPAPLTGFPPKSTGPSLLADGSLASSTCSLNSTPSLHLPLNPRPSSTTKLSLTPHLSGPVREHVKETRI